MGFFDKLKGIFNKIFKRNNTLDFLDEFKPEEIVESIPEPISEPEVYEPIELPEGELVSFLDGEVLDTNSRASEEKLKHNLEILIKKAKAEGKVDRFMLIREDDFFPTDWEWRVLSKNTNLERVTTSLSYEIRKAYALEKSGIPPYIDLMGMKVPNMVTDDKITEALSKVDKTLASVLLPSRFRSTKHFTVNTPLGVTGDYNAVESNRDYIIIDDMSAFLESQYGYSVSYHDAYLDISHESLPISEQAVVLINDENYERIMSDEKIASQLAQRRVVRFKGDEVLAIDMILTEMGALPSRIGSRYATYDQETRDILDSSIKDLADRNNLFFDKSHGGQLKPDGGHFSNYYDDKNKDYYRALEEFAEFLKQKFPEHEDLIPNFWRFNDCNAQDIVQKLGATNLLEAINEYNELATQKLATSLEQYKQDRQNITPEVHQQFVETIARINDFYKTNVDFVPDNIEEAIRKFIQSDTVSEQLEAAKSVWELLPSKDLDRTEDSAEKTTSIADKKISPAEAARNALVGTSVEKTDEVDRVERLELEPERSKEGITVDDK